MFSLAVLIDVDFDLLFTFFHRKIWLITCVEIIPKPLTALNMASAGEIDSSETEDPAAEKLKPMKSKLLFRKTDFRQCRLCMRVVSRADTKDSCLVGSDLRQKILDAVAVRIFSHDKITSVCINCVMLVDIINDFRFSCRKADMLQNGTKLIMLHPGNWLSNDNKSNLVSCHKTIKRNRAELDALYKCSGLDNEEVEEKEEKPVMKLEPVDVVVTCMKNEEDIECNIDEIDRDSDESEQSEPEQYPKFEKAEKKPSKKNAKDYMCELCGKLMQKAYMEQHVNMHTGLRPYKCPEENCNKTFASKAVLRKHTRKKKRFECETCHKSIQGWLFYQLHLQIHQGTNSQKLPCTVCGKTFYKSALR